MAIGFAPTEVIFLHDSATACFPPSVGSAAQYLGVESEQTASALFVP